MVPASVIATIGSDTVAVCACVCAKEAALFFSLSKGLAASYTLYSSPALT